MYPLSHGFQTFYVFFSVLLLTKLQSIVKFLHHLLQTLNKYSIENLVVASFFFTQIRTYTRNLQWKHFFHLENAEFRKLVEKMSIHKWRLRAIFFDWVIEPMKKITSFFTQNTQQLCIKYCNVLELWCVHTLTAVSSDFSCSRWNISYNHQCRALIHRCKDNRW